VRLFLREESSSLKLTLISRSRSIQINGNESARKCGPKEPSSENWFSAWLCSVRRLAGSFPPIVNERAIKATPATVVTGSGATARATPNILTAPLRDRGAVKFLRLRAVAFESRAPPTIEKSLASLAIESQLHLSSSTSVRRKTSYSRRSAHNVSRSNVLVGLVKNHH
jgi:hypothetical protein